MARRHVLVNALSLTQGGGRSYVLNVLRELDRDDRGLRVTVLVSPGQLAAGEVRNIEVETARIGGLARVAYEQMVLPFRARHFDLVYCLADVAPAFAHAPVVVALRNLNIYDHRFYDTPRLRILERLVSAGLKRARRVVFPSHAALALIRSRIAVPEDRAVVIHHGISHEVFRTEDPEPARAPYLFLPAALERHKNIPVLIRSLLHVRDARLEAWIAGGSSTDPRCARKLQQLVSELGLDARVRFLGPVPYREVLGYYRAARALVFPSLLETFGHPLLEAMLSSTPIVAADIPAFREIAADAALYFPPDDPQALAREIDRLESDPGPARERVELGRARAATFSWKNSVDRLCATFEDAMRSTRSALPVSNGSGSLS